MPSISSIRPESCARSFLRSRAAEPVYVGFVPSCRPTVSIYFSIACRVRHLHRYGVAACRGHRQVRS